MASAAIAERKSTALYRHFDAAGNLLYVGISHSLMGRIAKHEQSSQWFAKIASITIGWFDTRRAALVAEEAAIKSEAPQFNRTHNLAVTFWDELRKTAHGRQFIAECDFRIAFRKEREQALAEMAAFEATDDLADRL